MAVATPNLPRHFEETGKEVHAFISIIKRKMLRDRCLLFSQSGRRTYTVHTGGPHIDF